ncbi:hypothetical protein HYV84_06565 [Candidatus Woesearchaeota archaeon]|nr:hypothetical protein [Candidatus Woesearchaeota archaeon]
MKKLPLFIIGISILLTACSSSIFKRGQDSILTSEQKFTGSEGLVFEFFENAPPKEVFDKSPFPVGIRLHNKGACDIGVTDPNDPLRCQSLTPGGGSPEIDGILSIGFEDDYLEPPSSLQALLPGIVSSISASKLPLAPSRPPTKGTIFFSLKGKDLEDSQGEKQVITFNMYSKPLSTLDPQTEVRETPIIITACYKYRTSASADICVDTDVFGFKEKQKGCEVKPIELKDQGAPLAVTKIDPQMNPEKDDPGFTRPMFVITVENKGKGEAIQGNLGTIEGACSSTPVGYKQWNRVDVQAFVLDRNGKKEQLNCNLAEDNEPKDRLNQLAGVINLKGKEDRIRCQFKEKIGNDAGTFLTPLFIELDYGYTESISRTVKIKKSLTY